MKGLWRPIYGFKSLVTFHIPHRHTFFLIVSPLDLDSWGQPRAEVTSLPLDFAIAARYQGHSSAEVEGGMSVAAPPGPGPHRMQ